LFPSSFLFPENSIKLPGRRECFERVLLKDDFSMVERRIELKRRYHRKHKMRKLKTKLATAKEGREKDNILRKIHLLSPFWKQPKPEKA